PVDLGPYDLGPKGFVPLRVAFDAAGNAIALWSTAAGVWGSYRPFGGSWQPTVSVWPGITETLNLSVAADGNALAVWGASGYVYSATRSAVSGRWTAPSPLPGSGNVTGFGDDGALSADKAGNAVALWTANEAGNDVFRAALWPADVARWTKPEDLGSYFAAGFPTVAVDGYGDALAVWAEGLPDSVDWVSELHPGG